MGDVSRPSDAQGVHGFDRRILRLCQHGAQPLHHLGFHKTGSQHIDADFVPCQFEGEGADPLRGMFENLISLEDRIIGVFTQKSVETSRLLLTD